MKTVYYQTVTFADITLSAKAQEAIRYMQGDSYKAIYKNLDKLALWLCEKEINAAEESLELIQSVLLSRNLIYHIGTIDDD